MNDIGVSHYNREPPTRLLIILQALEAVMADAITGQSNCRVSDVISRMWFAVYESHLKSIITPDKGSLSVENIKLAMNRIPAVLRFITKASAHLESLCEIYKKRIYGDVALSFANIACYLGEVYRIEEQFDIPPGLASRAASNVILGPLTSHLVSLRTSQELFWTAVQLHRDCSPAWTSLGLASGREGRPLFACRAFIRALLTNEPPSISPFSNLPSPISAPLAILRALAQKFTGPDCPPRTTPEVRAFAGVLLATLHPDGPITASAVTPIPVRQPISTLPSPAIPGRTPIILSNKNIPHPVTETTHSDAAVTSPSSSRTNTAGLTPQQSITPLPIPLPEAAQILLSSLSAPCEPAALHARCEQLLVIFECLLGLALRLINTKQTPPFTLGFNSPPHLLDPAYLARAGIAESILWTLVARTARISIDYARSCLRANPRLVSSLSPLTKNSYASKCMTDTHNGKTVVSALQAAVSPTAWLFSTGRGLLRDLPSTLWSADDSFVSPLTRSAMSDEDKVISENIEMLMRSEIDASACLDKTPLEWIVEWLKSANIFKQELHSYLPPKIELPDGTTSDDNCFRKNFSEAAIDGHLLTLLSVYTWPTYRETIEVERATAYLPLPRNTSPSPHMDSFSARSGTVGGEEGDKVVVDKDGEVINSEEEPLKDELDDLLLDINLTVFGESPAESNQRREIMESNTSHHAPDAWCLPDDPFYTPGLFVDEGKEEDDDIDEEEDEDENRSYGSSSSYSDTEIEDDNDDEEDEMILVPTTGTLLRLQQEKGVVSSPSNALTARPNISDGLRFIHHYPPSLTEERMSGNVGSESLNSISSSSSSSTLLSVGKHDDMDDDTGVRNLSSNLKNKKRNQNQQEIPNNNYQEQKHPSITDENKKNNKQEQHQHPLTQRDIEIFEHSQYFVPRIVKIRLHSKRLRLRFFVIRPGVLCLPILPHYASSAPTYPEIENDDSVDEVVNLIRRFFKTVPSSSSTKQRELKKGRSRKSRRQVKSSSKDREDRPGKRNSKHNNRREERCRLKQNQFQQDSRKEGIAATKSEWMNGKKKSISRPERKEIYPSQRQENEKRRKRENIKSNKIEKVSQEKGSGLSRPTNKILLEKQNKGVISMPGHHDYVDLSKFYENS